MSILLISYTTIPIGPIYVYIKYGIATTAIQFKYPFIAENIENWPNNFISLFVYLFYLAM